MSTLYQYVGDGAGIPGLPHEITDEEAEAKGVTRILQAAIENGSYVEAQAEPQEPDQPRKIKK